MEVMEYKGCLVPLIKQFTCCALALIGMYASNAQQHMPSSPSNVYDQQKATFFPVMDLETIDSTIFNTANLATKTVYIDFWFTACPPCLKEIPFAKNSSLTLPAIQTLFF
jgi:thiol-disulfide isomerase/thioredoxin